jgi:hypothetical protein
MSNTTIIIPNDASAHPRWSLATPMIASPTPVVFLRIWL